MATKFRKPKKKSLKNAMEIPRTNQINDDLSHEAI